ncbi:hypothetical protein [Amycolatopsis kentuckyensis]|uniref:hypothetical protein n=1 Tax=Amycolatopsis kentuckyensis TaxID=218823 RepID=UPI003564CB9B
MDETDPSRALTDLSELEQEVVAAARRGGVAKPATARTVEELALTDDPELLIRADLLRELLRGMRGDLDPRGFQVVGARVIGQLDLDHVSAVTGLDLYRCALPDGIVCRDARLRYLHLNGSLLSSLDADGLRADSDLLMRDTAITGAGERGALRLLGAQIGGTLELDRATITGTEGPAVDAERLRVGSSFFMRDATIAGAGERGALRLLDARIGGSCQLERANITSARGPALTGELLRIDGNLFMQGAATTGSGELGAIRLSGARISGQAALLMSKLENTSGPLLILHEAQITGALFPPALVCPAGRQGMSRRGCPDSDRIITAHGLTYPVLREISWRQWLHLLVHHTPSYWPQPFQQLATTERAVGHENNAREVLITQQHDLRRRAPHDVGNRLARGRHALWGWLGRYGYRADRLMLALGVVFTLAAGVGLVAGHVTSNPGHHAAERVPPATASASSPAATCSPVELIGLGIDRGLPLGTTGLRARCDLDTVTAWGQTFTVILWALQALLWGLATLAIAAYTGLVRKPT